MSPTSLRARSPQSWLGHCYRLISLHLSLHSLLVSASIEQVPINTVMNIPTTLDNGSCKDSPLSCHNSSTVEDLCCFNAPGGTLLLTQFWDTHPATGPHDSWTLHGLWPDNCDGTYEAYCDDARNYKDIADILENANRTETLDFMRTYWKDYHGNDNSFWQHEWGKHGTCVSTLSPSCFTDYAQAEEVPLFFDRAVELFKSLPTYDWLKEAGIEPSTTARYTSAQIQDALSKNFGGAEVRLGCRYGQLNEIWYFHNVRGSIQDGTFVPTDVVGSGSNCPKTGIRYLPKDGAPAPTTTRPGSKPTSNPTPGSPFVGRGQLTVSISGNTKGCIISAGAWYVSGTCASFVATKHDESFTLKSSRGSCGIVDGEFKCDASVKASEFEASDSKLLFNGTDTFYADVVPKGRKKSSIFVGSGHDLDVQIHWRQ
ncbi:hypothetical protein AMS68_006119 [Peltaster fructicola]|uniref:Ribonuclease T2-like n=1 Tax=Peltaster fructicola TaxID=286661 RepID=A0A6H0Y0P5_9PEZI|nr:hypothetical protein AMS68_006119 [Peltaster fructicola]